MADSKQAGVIEITQIRSDIGAQQAQRRTLRALGLRRIRHTVSHQDRPEIRGMLAKVAHLVEVRPAEQPKSKAKQSKKGEGERQRAGGRGSTKGEGERQRAGGRGSTKKDEEQT
jgi:large subunit ribosomal protein L30